jgi:hypothetical protein
VSRGGTVVESPQALEEGLRIPAHLALADAPQSEALPYVVIITSASAVFLQFLEFIAPKIQFLVAAISRREL